MPDDDDEGGTDVKDVGAMHSTGSNAKDRSNKDFGKDGKSVREVRFKKKTATKKRGANHGDFRFRSTTDADAGTDHVSNALRQKIYYGFEGASELVELSRSVSFRRTLMVFGKASTGRAAPKTLKDVPRNSRGQFMHPPDDDGPCVGRETASKGGDLWCKCTNEGKPIGGRSGRHPSGPEKCVDPGQLNLCQWDASINVCVPKSGGGGGADGDKDQGGSASGGSGKFGMKQKQCKATQTKVDNKFCSGTPLPTVDEPDPPTPEATTTTTSTTTTSTSALKVQPQLPEPLPRGNIICKDKEWEKRPGDVQAPGQLLNLRECRASGSMLIWDGAGKSLPPKSDLSDSAAPDEIYARRACQCECERAPLCVAVVFGPGGTMLKKAGPEGTPDPGGKVCCAVGGGDGPGEPEPQPIPPKPRVSYKDQLLKPDPGRLKRPDPGLRRQPEPEEPAPSKRTAKGNCGNNKVFTIWHPKNCGKGKEPYFCPTGNKNHKSTCTGVWHCGRRGITDAVEDKQCHFNKFMNLNDVFTHLGISSLDEMLRDGSNHGGKAYRFRQVDSADERFRRVEDAKKEDAKEEDADYQVVSDPLRKRIYYGFEGDADTSLLQLSVAVRCFLFLLCVCGLFSKCSSLNPEI